MTKTASARKAQDTSNVVRMTRTDDGQSLRLYGIVGDDFDGFTDDAVRDVLEGREGFDGAQNVEPVSGDLVVHLNSPGGFVDQGMAVYSALRDLDGGVTIQVDGLAASIASVIAMAGTVRMHPGSMMMIHNPWNMAMGDANEMRKNAEMLDKVSESIIAIYQRKTGQDEDTIRTMMEEETWLTAQDAAEWGFADSVIDGVDEEVAARAMAALDLSVLPSLDNRVAAAAARYKIAGTARDDRAATPSAETTPTVTEDSSMTTNHGQNASAADTNAAEPKNTAKSEEDIRNEAQAAERERVSEIQRSVRAAKLPQDFADELIKGGDTVDQARAKVIDRWQEQANEPETSNVQRVQVGHDVSDKFRAQATDAVLMRAGQKQMDTGNEMRGFGLMDHARAALEQVGYRTANMGKTEIAKAVLSTTSDFPSIFENAMHKTLLGAYEGVDLTWSRIASQGDLSDFRPHNRYRMGSFGRLKGLDENGEIRHTTMPDAEKESIAAGENGLIFTLSYKMLVDDDMGAFLNIAQSLGRTAALSVEEDFYSLLVSNPTMSDGKALFQTSSHKNLASSGAAPSVDTLADARAAMRKQKDPGGNSYIMLRPRLLLVPEALVDPTEKIVNPNFEQVATTTGEVNTQRGRWDVVSSPYLDENSTTAWYAFADPANAPAFEVGFVNGQTTPMVETEESFDSRGIKYRVTHDYGVAARDYRPAYKNPGA